MSDFDLNDLLSTFFDEAADDVACLEQGLLQLEISPNDAELRQAMLRRAHTIKGNASCVGLAGVADFAHAYEGVLERIDGGALQLSAELAGLLLSGIDTLRRLIDEKAVRLDDGDRELIATLTAGTGVSPSQDELRDGPKSAATGRTMRIAAEKLNRMLDLAGEIAIARGRVHQLLAVRSDLEVMAEVERQVDVLQGELQELIMRARMVPVGTLFRSYARSVHDLAAAHGKNARLVTLGNDVEVDSSAVQMLRDPLSHMIRNAIDHGIEPSPQRVAAGKPPIGQITLEARHEAGSIIIRLSDDGAGLDRNKILERAASRGIDTERLSETDGYGLIFEPGFSTANAVSDLSGRGVGMDVVRHSIDALRGSVAISTRRGEGTTFTIRLPLMLAVIDGFRVSAAEESYVVPMEHVVECVELPASERQQKDCGVLLLREEVVPYVRLRALFALEAAPPPRESVLIVHHERLKAGLVVDELHGGGQVVIKPLGKYFDDIPGIAGSSILGNGQVALILDTPAILRNLQQEREDA